jgi:hypothetical protein
VRAAAVYDLGPDEGDVLRVLAREDAEARVRRAAVARLDDVATLGEIVRTDPDADVRTEARAPADRSWRRNPRSSQSHRGSASAHRRRASQDVVVIVRESAHAEVRAASGGPDRRREVAGGDQPSCRDAATAARALARLQDPKRFWRCR